MLYSTTWYVRGIVFSFPKNVCARVRLYNVGHTGQHPDPAHAGRRAPARASRRASAVAVEATRRTAWPHLARY